MPDFKIKMKWSLLLAFMSIQLTHLTLKNPAVFLSQASSCPDCEIHQMIIEWIVGVASMTYRPFLRTHACPEVNFRSVFVDQLG